MFGTSFLMASKDAQDFGRKAIELTRQNANATFDFAVQMLGVRSFSQAVELQRVHKYSANHRQYLGDGL